MALTQHLFYGSNFQPAVALPRLMRDPVTRGLLRRLRGRSLTLAELDLDEAGTQVLRRLRRVNLVTVYEIGGVAKYRGRRWPPAVEAALVPTTPPLSDEPSASPVR